VTDEQMIEQVISRLRGDNAALQEVSAAILSRDEVRIRAVFHRVVGIDLTNEQLQTVLHDYSNEQQIAAST
jgi:hypothetical protein